MTIYWGEAHQAPGFDSIDTPTKTLLKQVVSAGLKKHPAYKKLDCQLNITFAGQLEIADLNRVYRGKDTPTDVLSFPSEGAKPMPAPRKGCRSKPVLNLGDIVICPEVAAAQALEYGHSFDRELAFLTAHGLLHLLGYDHRTPDEEGEMIAMQKEILTWLGVGR